MPVPTVIDAGEEQNVFDIRHHKTETHTIHAAVGVHTGEQGSSVHASSSTPIDGKKPYKPEFKKHFKPHGPRAPYSKPQE